MSVNVQVAVYFSFVILYVHGSYVAVTHLIDVKKNIWAGIFLKNRTGK